MNYNMSMNIGVYNIGFNNIGGHNCGGHLLGSWNMGHGHLSYFCHYPAIAVDEGWEIMMFNKPLPYKEIENFNWPKWLISFNPLEKYDKELNLDENYKKTAKRAWDETTEEDRQLTFTLPNFDADIFYDIFGIDVRKKEVANE